MPHHFLQQNLRAEIRQHGAMPFSRFMEQALYGVGGYYTSTRTKLGSSHDGSDFVTAPELTPLFAQTLARQAAPILAASAPHILEFGAGTGQLAHDMLLALEAQGTPLSTYTILELSPDLRARQQEKLAPWLSMSSSNGNDSQKPRARVFWLSSLPENFSGLMLGNEVLDAMPVDVVRKVDAKTWCEQGVGLNAAQEFIWQDLPQNFSPTLSNHPTGTRSAIPLPVLRPDVAHYIAQHFPEQHLSLPEGYVTETHNQACAFINSVLQCLNKGAVLLIDYGFPANEYYHVDRHSGTLMCHRAHRAHAEVLHQVGEQDLTAHVNFSAIAQTAVDAGADHIGYTSQARFLLNNGLLDLVETKLASINQTYGENSVPAITRSAALRAAVSRLLSEAEMGELFKVIAFGKNLETPESLDWQGFTPGDRSHRL